MRSKSERSNGFKEVTDMKGLDNVAKRSTKIKQENMSTWLPIYFSFKTNTVYTTGGEDRFFVTKLIRPNKPEEIKEAIERWKRM